MGIIANFYPDSSDTILLVLDNSWEALPEASRQGVLDKVFQYIFINYPTYKFAWMYSLDTDLDIGFFCRDDNIEYTLNNIQWPFPNLGDMTASTPLQVISIDTPLR